MKTRFLILAICILSLSVSCDKPRKSTTLTDEEIVKTAIVQGNEISEVTQMVLASRLKKVVQEEGIAQALKYCNVNAYPIVDSLEDVYHTKVKRTTFKTRNTGNTPNEMEGSVIDDYMQQISNAQTPGVKTILDDENVHYFKPIIISADLCLNCHGDIGSDILEENYKIIQELYPDDNATGYKLGDLRGIWSISFKKETLDQN